MAALTWDEIGSRFYETGVKKGVLYPVENGAYPNGYAWNGVTAINENSSGAESTALYADNIKYLNLVSEEEYKATIEAYTYPDEFAECDGSAEIATGVSVRQQKRKSFGLSYVTQLGNDTDGADYGYKLHLVYGAMAAPTDRSYATINDSPEAITLSWEISTTPVEVAGHKPTSTIVIDSTKVDSTKLKALETILYGSTNQNPRLPLPSEIITLFSGT